MSGEGDSYECAVCHGTFTKTWSDEEAQAERESTWVTPFNRDDGDTVCDDCYQRITAWAQSEHPEYLR